MRVPKPVFGIVEVAAKEPGRYAIGGVHLTRLADGSPVAIATDGRCLLAHRFKESIGPDEKPEPVPENLIVNAKHWKAIGSKVPKNGRGYRGAEISAIQPPTPEQTEEQKEKNETPEPPPPQVTGTPVEGISLKADGEQGIFPKWKQVVRRDCENDRLIMVSARQAAKFFTALAKIHEGELKEDTVTLSIPENPSRPIVAFAGVFDDKCTVGVLMPVDDRDYAESSKPIPPVNIDLETMRITKVSGA